MSLKMLPATRRYPLTERFHALDLSLGTRFNRLGDHSLLCLPFRVVSRLGDGLVWYVIMLLLPLMYGKAGLFLSLQMAVTGLVATWIYLWIKRTTGRLRPCEAYPHIQAYMRPLDRFSFPSGHTLHAVAFSCLLMAALPLWTPWLLVFTALVALSRLVLGLHYPTDVLVGAALGWLLAKLSLALVSFSLV